MKKRILSLILTVAMMLSVMTILPISVSAEENTFDISEYDTTEIFTISTATDLVNFQNAVSTSGKTFAGKTVELAADIDLQGVTWEGIGITSGKPFSGNFDGNGHTISNMSQTYSSKPDGKGGLFGFIRVPANSEVEIKDFTLTGDVRLNGSGGAYFGTVVSCVDAGTSGNGGTFNMTNVHSSVNIWGAASSLDRVGGMIGQIRDKTDLVPVTLNIDSCVYDGTMEFAHKVSMSGGIIGFSGYNQSNRPLTINITNTVFAGDMILLTSEVEDLGLFIGYLKGNASTGNLELNVKDCMATGVMTFADGQTWKSASAACLGVVTGESLGSYATANVDNFYYRSFTIPGQDVVPVAQAVSNGVSDVDENTVAPKTLAEIAALTANAFSAEAKFSFKASTYWDTYYPCPTGLVKNGEWVDSLKVSVDAQVLGAQIRITDPADDYSGIRFVAEFRETLTTDAGTANANFGLILVSKTAYNTWSALEGEAKTFAALVEAGVQVPAVKATTKDGVVTVKATVYNIQAANYRDEIVAIPYVDGAIVGEAVARSIFGVATDCVADANATTVQKTFAQEIIDNAPAVEE